MIWKIIKILLSTCFTHKNSVQFTGDNFLRMYRHMVCMYIDPCMYFFYTKYVQWCSRCKILYFSFFSRIIFLILLYFTTLVTAHCPLIHLTMFMNMYTIQWTTLLVLTLNGYFWRGIFFKYNKSFFRNLAHAKTCH